MLDIDKLLESPPIDTSQKDFWDYDIESLLARHSAFTSLAELVKSQQEDGYIPTIDTRRDKGDVKGEKTALANELTHRGINVYHDGKFSLGSPDGGRVTPVTPEMDALLNDPFWDSRAWRRAER